VSEARRVSVDFILEKDDVKGAWRRLFTRDEPQWWLWPALFAVVVVTGLLGPNTWLIWIGAASLAWWLLSWALFLRRAARRASFGRQHYTFGAGGVTVEYPDVEARISWGHFERLERIGDAYVLRSPRGTVLIPRRAFARPQDEDEFLTIATSRLPENATRL